MRRTCRSRHARPARPSRSAPPAVSQMFTVAQTGLPDALAAPRPTARWCRLRRAGHEVAAPRRRGPGRAAPGSAAAGDEQDHGRRGGTRGGARVLSPGLPHTRRLVTNRRLARSSGVNDAVAERLPAAAAGAGAESFEALYERTFPQVYAYVASLVRDRAAAEDVTAQAFERAYRKRRSYRARRGSVEAWLFGIARNAALDELRRRKRRATLEVEPEDTSAPSRRRARRAGAAPRDRARRAGRARRPRAGPGRPQVQGGLSNAEIARVLGMSESQRRNTASPDHHEAAGGLQ